MLGPKIKVTQKSIQSKTCLQRNFKWPHYTY